MLKLWGSCDKSNNKLGLSCATKGKEQTKPKKLRKTANILRSEN
jgi:hypothetical protein